MFQIGSGIMIVISLSLTGLVLLAGEHLIAMFGLTPESVAIGKNFFFSIAGFYFVYGFCMAVRGYLEGTGDMLFSGAAGIAALLVRIACSYGFRDLFGNMVVAYAEAFSWIFLLGLLVRRYWTRRRTGKRDDFGE